MCFFSRWDETSGLYLSGSDPSFKDAKGRGLHFRKRKDVFKMNMSFFIIIIIRTQVRGEYEWKALCQDSKPLDPWIPNDRQHSPHRQPWSILSFHWWDVQRPDGFCGEPKTFLGWEGRWNSHWTSLSLGHLQNQNSCWATQSSHQWHLSAETHQRL